MEAFGDRLRKLRTRKGLSLDGLAAASGLSKAYLWKLERKPNVNPSLDVARRLAEVLGVAVSAVVSADTVQGAEDGAETTDIPLSLRRAVHQFSIPERDVRDLASIRFRGGQPTTADDWMALYLELKRAVPQD